MATSGLRVPHLRYGSPFNQADAEGEDAETLPVVLWTQCIVEETARHDKGSHDESEMHHPSHARRTHVQRPYCNLGRVTFCIRGRNLVQAVLEKEEETTAALRGRSDSLANGERVLEGYSIRAAQIIDQVNDQLLVVPVTLSESSSYRTRGWDSCGTAHAGRACGSGIGGDEDGKVATESNTPSQHDQEQEQKGLTLTEWLKMVRRESSKKAPLPRDWQSLPLHRLAELAVERAFQVMRLCI